MMKRFAAFAACLALILGCVAGLAGCSQQSELKLGTGNEGGMYYRFGNALSEASANDDAVPTIAVETTAGSSANLRLLSQGFLDMATVQADTLYDAANGTGLFANSGSYDGFSAVTGLYTEACQIVVRADSGIRSVSDLVGKTVSIGERESGVLQNALQILDAYNLKESDFVAEYLGFSDAAAALADGSIDAAFVTAAVPTPAVASLADSAGMRLVGLDAPVIDALLAHYDYYMPCTVPANTYAGQADAVQTVGVRAVLVARNGMSSDQVRAVLNLLFDEGIPLSATLGDGLQPVLEDASVGVPVGFHPGAASYLVERGIVVEEAADGGTSGGVTASQDD